MTRLLVLVAICFLSGCRLLPPIIGATEDEKILRHLEQLSWTTQNVPVHFDADAVELFFGPGTFNKNIWTVIPRDQYEFWHPDHSAGIRKIFKFHVSETDGPSGVLVFLHEYAHAANYIDIFDMPYNEFLSIAFELHVVTLAARDDPDLAVQFLNKSMGLWFPRDAHYEEQEHMRARLWLAALLEEEEPLEIYRWAKAASKEEFENKIRRTLGNKPRDVVRRGLVAFAKRHFPGDYISLLLSIRGKNDSELRLKKVTEHLKSMSPDQVYFDNLKWQQMRELSNLNRHQEVVAVAESIWNDCESSLLAGIVSQTAFHSACLSSDDSVWRTWKERSDGVSRWKGDELNWQFVKIKSMLDGKLISPEIALEKFSEVTQKPYYKHHPSLHEVIQMAADETIKLGLQEMTVDWSRGGLPLIAEEEFERLRQASLPWMTSEVKRLIRQAQMYLLSKRADEAFEMGDMRRAYRLYKKSDQGRHILEATFWHSLLP